MRLQARKPYELKVTAESGDERDALHYLHRLICASACKQHSNVAAGPGFLANLN